MAFTLAITLAVHLLGQLLTFLYSIQGQNIKIGAYQNFDMNLLCNVRYKRIQAMQFSTPKKIETPPSLVNPNLLTGWLQASPSISNAFNEPYLMAGGIA
jgi:hypothetical protein